MTPAKATLAAAEARPQVSFDGVRLTFLGGDHPTTALDGVSFAVARGEFVAVVGPSGCGKSTLLNLVAGLMRPTEGEVYYEGSPILGINRSVGYVTQKDNLLGWRTVRDNITLPLALRRVRRSERNRRAAELIERVGLAGFADHYPSQLSGGMRKRASLARTLSYEPTTLLMDEPFSALDAQMQFFLQNQLCDLCAESDVTVIFVTHDLVEAIALADRVIVMSARPGRIIASRTPGFAKPRDILGIRYHPEFQELHNSLWELLAPEAERVA